MLNLLWYVLIGIGVAILMVIDEWIGAKLMGFSVDDYSDWFIDEYDDGIVSDEYPMGCRNEGWYKAFKVIIGLVLWPFRAGYFHDRQIERYNAYIAYLNEEEEEP